MIEQKFFMRYPPHQGPWMVKGLQTLIDENLTDSMVMAEIGCYAGEASLMFAKKVARIHCIDCWSESTNPPQQGEIYQSMEEVESIFNESISKLSNVSKVKGLSVEAAKEYSDGFFDFVYIDAGHTTEDIRSDFKAWYPKVKIGGLVGGHDYNNWGVILFMPEIPNYEKIRINIYEDYSWIFKKT